MTESDITNIPVPSEVYESDDALDSYLAGVQDRLYRRKLEREHQRASARHEKVLAAYHEARTVGAEEVAAELAAVSAGFVARLTSMEEELGICVIRCELPLPYGLTEPLEAETSEDVCSSRDVIGLAEASPTPEIADAPADEPLPQFVSETPISAEPLVEDPEAGIRALEALYARNALIADLISRLAEIKLAWATLDQTALRDGTGRLRLEDCFRLRALTCRAAGLYAKAGDAHSDHELSAEVEALRRQLRFAAENSGESADCLPLDGDFWQDGPSPLAANHWAELNTYYLGVADTQEAVRRFDECADLVDPHPRGQLANAIAARYELPTRRLAEIGGSDAMLYSSYSVFKFRANSCGKLPARQATTGIKNLVAAAAGLPDLLKLFNVRAAEGVLANEKIARKRDAISAVADWDAKTAMTKWTASKMAGQKRIVHELLDACIAAEVPYSDKQVRTAMLVHGPVLLANEPRFAKLLGEIHAERKRLKMESMPPPAAPPVEEQPDIETEKLLQRVVPFTTGKRILMLGGTRRPRTEAEMKAALKSESFQWLTSVKTDKAAKFETEICKSDILLLLKNLAGHELVEKGKEWIQAVGGHSITLRKGHGCKAIILSISEHVDRKDAHSGNGS